MTREKELELKELLHEKLEYWVDKYQLNETYRKQLVLDAIKSGQYSIAEELAADNRESSRISENIKALERALRCI